MIERQTLPPLVYAIQFAIWFVCGAISASILFFSAPSFAKTEAREPYIFGLGFTRRMGFAFGAGPVVGVWAFVIWHFWMGAPL